MIRRNPLRLLLVGIAMTAALALPRLSPYLWPPAILSALAGIYLIAWATFARGYWCRACKRFDPAIAARTRHEPH